MGINFAIPRSARKPLKQIVDRVLGLLGPDADRLSITMDLCACHANGCPLDFERLASADDFNLLHDVGGINRHINRDTGKIEGFFRPRFARNDAAKKERAA